MAANIVHLTNGDSFTECLRSIIQKETILTWNEILCEGPTYPEVLSEAFIDERIAYLKRFEPTAETKYHDFVAQFDVLNTSHFDTVVLWFEYDLFCHINLAAACSYMASQLPNTTFYLVCSGHIPEKEGLFGLSELSEEAILREYENKVLLNASDRNSLIQFWETYCSDDHSRLREVDFDAEKLPYLSECITAHLQRFPSEENGLNALETQVLKAIDDNELTSTHTLVGQLLRNQGYYGFGDLQWFQIVERLWHLFDQDEVLKLTDTGSDILHKNHNVLHDLQDNTLFGRCAKYDYLYSSTKQAIAKR
ncbi:DUF1835 domain-containing protein [Aureisphaera galaxeae]|uniref:DUF1835 domain-containing protein n=1 Tax=Aureisphaera galaxeae TaxID=1538023 RepID=UPI0023508808|nr:DUF1835 domain-containing protein [Aureisphaera galaxeae]MDC8004214.1 DUF1835 domain-containing protein [Aureisphaera galaxeae]